MPSASTPRLGKEQHVTLSDLIRPTRTHVAPRPEASTPAREIDTTETPQRLSRLRGDFHGIAIVCPAEALRVADTAQWVRRHGLTVAAYSSSELALAISAGIEPKRLVMHGDGSKWGPIRCACNAEVRQFVVNSGAQVSLLEYYGPRHQQVILDVDTDHFDDTMNAIGESDRLELVGLHCRLDARAAVAPHRYAGAIDAMVAQMAKIRLSRGRIPCSVSLAGPVGDSPRTVTAVIDAATEAACRLWHFPRPRLAFTPQVS
jgi:diaminopimelate decarboxylase